VTGDQPKFAKLNLKNEGFMTYIDNNKGKILGTTTISNESSFNIKDVLLIEGLKHNLISISQLCDKGLSGLFSKNKKYMFLINDRKKKEKNGKKV